MIELKRFLPILIVLILASGTFAQHIETISEAPPYQLRCGGSPLSPAQSQSPASEEVEPHLLPSVAPVSPSKKLSGLEQHISGALPATVSTKIRPFGYELFAETASRSAPVVNVPLGRGYIVGTGDEIKVRVWGESKGQWKTVVNRAGNINLPRVGILHVAGLLFDELKEVLHKAFSKHYKGLKGFEMSVTMGALRTMRIYVVCNARRPGTYIVSSRSTLGNALFRAGGPGEAGTMRNIQLRRKGRMPACLDMYDYLLRGSNAKDVWLMPEDVIFIPPVGPQVGIAGNVKNPAIYELRGETRLLDLIEMAGGPTVFASKGRVQVRRIEGHQFKTVFEVDLIDIGKNPENNFTVMDGDLVRVLPVAETKNPVNTTGAVAGPGKRATPESQFYRTVTIAGEVKSPGTYIRKKGKTISSLIEKAGGYTDRAYLRGAVFTRESARELQQKGWDAMIARLERELLYVPIEVSTSLSPVEIQARRSARDNKQKFIAYLKAVEARGRTVVKLAHVRLLKNSEHDIELEDGDILIIPQRNNVINVTGAVMAPGSFLYGEQHGYDDYIAQAGGFTRYADEDEVYVLRVDGTVTKLSREFIGWNPIQSRWEVTAFNKKASELEPGDTIIALPKLEHMAWLREVRDINQMLLQAAVVAGVTINLF